MTSLSRGKKLQNFNMQVRVRFIPPFVFVLASKESAREKLNFNSFAHCILKRLPRSYSLIANINLCMLLIGLSAGLQSVLNLGRMPTLKSVQQPEDIFWLSKLVGFAM